MLHPRISLSPKQLGRSTSASKAQPSHQALMRASPSSHADPHKSSSHFAPASYTPGSGGAMGAETPLINNLKQQIQCLEMEVKYLKSTPSAKSPAGGDLMSVTSAAAHRNANTTVGSHAGRANNEELLRRADELEDEVTELRQKFAIREQEHQLELSSLRQMLDSDNKSAGAHRSLREELERRDAQVKADVTSLKMLHAQEIVALQRTIERMQLEKDNASSTNKFLTTERETAANEIVSLRDACRSATAAQENAQKQLQEAMIHLTTEQGLRRSTEVRELALKEANEELQKEVKRLRETGGSHDETSRRYEGDLQNLRFEIEQLKLTVERQKADLARAASDVIDAKAKVATTATKFTELEEKLAKAAQGLVDLQSEREYFRLQTDRLKVENSVLEVKSAQFEQTLNAERSSLLTMERQLCTALDQAEQLRRDARQKEDVYRGIDQYASETRVRLRIAEQDRDELRKKFDASQAALESLNDRYAHVKHLEDQQRLEQQLQQALQQLAKSKHEMQLLLSHQQRINEEFNTAMIDLPEVTHAGQHQNASINASMVVSKAAVSPTRSSHMAAGAVSASQVDDLPAVAVLQPPMAAATLSDPQSAAERMSTEDVQRELREMSLRIQREEDQAAAVLREA